MNLTEQLLGGKSIGTVEVVDTLNVTIKVKKDSDSESRINNIQVNQLICIRSTNTAEVIIGLVIKIMRKSAEENTQDSNEDTINENIMHVSLVGTLRNKQGTEENVFKRTLDTIPTINAACFIIEGENLTDFMKSISKKTSGNNLFKLGNYSIAKSAEAFIDGNKFFQRHAIIVGGTGSGKSWTVANILEKSAKLESTNSIVYDIHGEYEPIADIDNVTHLKIAGPSDTADNDNIIFLPYWLLSVEEIQAMLLDRSDSNAPNQARALFDAIIFYKREKLHDEGKQEVLDNFTIDSPVPYDIEKVLREIEILDTEMVQGVRGEKQGPLYGKFTRFMQRLHSKKTDKRLNFIFNNNKHLQNYNWLPQLINKLMGFGNQKGIKIIDCSEVPSDILPLVLGLITRLIFSVQQWMNKDARQPIALFCDEAHLYMPAHPREVIEERGLSNFERIAKEGRKYGIALIVISQRPSDVSKTVLSQCGNFIAMRLTNPEDQNIVKQLFPDNLGNFADLLSILDIGEGLIVGDACLLPSRVKIDEPNKKPNSATVDFWDEWSEPKTERGIEQAVESLRKQIK